jgi:valyl-tRNA synthetase
VAAGADPAVSELAALALGEIRKAKTEAKKSLIAPVERVVIADTAARRALLAEALGDVQAAGRITQPIELVDAGTFRVEVTLASED